MRDDPTVAVTHPKVRHYTEDRTVTMHEILVVDCSVCGLVTDYDDNRPEVRERPQRIAKAHAEEVHEGLVAAEGWVR